MLPKCRSMTMAGGSSQKPCTWGTGNSVLLEHLLHMHLVAEGKDRRHVLAFTPDVQGQHLILDA